MNVSLTSNLREYVRSKVDSGGYESASEVIRESLRTLQERDRAQQVLWTDIRRKVAVARRQAAQGKLLDGEKVMGQMIRAANGTRRNTPRKKARR